MTFYRIKLIIHLDKINQINYISKFVGELLKDKIHHFLHLKVEIKSQYIVITGYTIHSLSNKDNALLWIYLYNGIDAFIHVAYNDFINEVEKDQDNIYINCFAGFMSTYYK